MQVHQIIPALHDADATGDSARALRDYLRSRGYPSDIYTYTLDDTIPDEAIDFHQSRPQMEPSDLLILQYALPSGMSDFLKQTNCRKA
ncbi:MAG TPA: hypothetical protein VI958_08915, partial [Acidobacteriota bacterium]